MICKNVKLFVKPSNNEFFVFCRVRKIKDDPLGFPVWLDDSLFFRSFQNITTLYSWLVGRQNPLRLIK